MHNYVAMLSSDALQLLVDISWIFNADLGGDDW